MMIPQFQEPLARLQEATSLALMVMTAWTVVRMLAVRLLEEGLNGTCPTAGDVARLLEVWATAAEQRLPRARAPDAVWGDPLAAAGRRRPDGGAGSPVAPLDAVLGVVAHQRTGAEVQWMGCLLAVFVPYETACRLLCPLTGVSLAAGTVWTWVQQVGQGVMAQLADELERLAAGTLPPAEPLAPGLAALPLVMGADGVMVPFRRTRARRRGKPAGGRSR